jgi:hypothetical protein
VAQESAAAAAHETLDRLEGKIDRALLQDYEHSLGAALRTLRAAASSGSTPEQRMRGLDQARHDLHRAYAVAPDVVARSEVQELVSATWLLAQCPQDALDALEEAATLLRDALYATTLYRVDVRAEVYGQRQPTTSVLARARRWWDDKWDAQTLEFVQTWLREVHERGAAAAEIGDRLGRVQTARRALGVPHADPPLPVIRRESLRFNDEDVTGDLIHSFIVGWEPPASDEESTRYASYVAARERFERVRDEANRRKGGDDSP